MVEPGKTLCLCNSDLGLDTKYGTHIKIVTDKSIKDSPIKLIKGMHIHAYPRFLIFYGHGTDSEMIGSDNKPLFNINDADKFRGWCVYAMACKTARVLGPAIIRAGGFTYIGYTDCVKFIPWTEEFFGECVSNVVIELKAHGKNAFDAVRLTKEKFDYYIKEYNKKYNEENDKHIKELYRKTYVYLIHDKKCLTLLGLPNVFVTPPEKVSKGIKMQFKNNEWVIK